MFTIRRAQPEDAESVFGLASTLATSFAVERHAYEISFAELLATPHAFLSVAQAGTPLVGYLLGFDHYTFYANGRVSWVEEVMVAADYRRRGVGRLLMARFEHWARSRNSRLVALSTRRAAAFYTALGYEESSVYFRKVLD